MKSISSDGFADCAPISEAIWELMRVASSLPICPARTNASVMMRYIGSAENMCLMMNLLRDEARSIQFEAFHVFKVFVANPNKSEQITQILLKNREKLMNYLAAFQNDREDEQFAEEKAMLTRLLERMAEPGEKDAATS